VRERPATASGAGPSKLGGFARMPPNGRYPTDGPELTAAERTAHSFYNVAGYVQHHLPGPGLITTLIARPGKQAEN